MRKAVRLFLAAAVFEVTASGASTVSLAGAPSATGLIIDAAGQPAAGVPLKVTGPIGEATVFTDGSGVWTLYELPAGDHQIIPFGNPSGPVGRFTMVDYGGARFPNQVRHRLCPGSPWEPNTATSRLMRDAACAA